MKIVLLPGMDGTGYLFEPFMKQAPPDLEVLVLPLVQSPTFSYAQQAESIRSQIGEASCILVAESYSGMVAYEMLMQGCENIKHLIFAASFISRPSRLAAVAKFIPAPILKSTLLPKWLVQRFLFGKYGTHELVSRFYRAISAVKSDVLKHRLKQVAGLDKPSQRIKIPCTYIRPLEDRMVSAKAVRELDELCEQLTIAEVEGTHFVLQTSPERSWEIIKRVAALAF